MEFGKVDLLGLPVSGVGKFADSSVYQLIWSIPDQPFAGRRRIATPTVGIVLDDHVAAVVGKATVALFASAHLSIPPFALADLFGEPPPQQY